MKNRKLFIGIGLLLGALPSVAFWFLANDLFEPSEIVEVSSPFDPNLAVLKKDISWTDRITHLYVQDYQDSATLNYVDMVDNQEGVFLNEAYWSKDGSVLVVLVGRNERGIMLNVPASNDICYDFRLHRRVNGSITSLIKERGGIGYRLSDFDFRPMQGDEPYWFKQP